MMRRDVVPMQLSKNFRKLLREEAAKKDMSMVDYSDWISKNSDEADKFFKRNNYGKNNW